MKAWPIDPSGLKKVPLEVSEKLPQGSLAWGSQAFRATLLCDLSMSALPIIETQKSQSVGCFTHQWERREGRKGRYGREGRGERERKEGREARREEREGGEGREEREKGD